MFGQIWQGEYKQLVITIQLTLHPLLLTGLGSLLGRSSDRRRDPLPWLVGLEVAFLSSLLLLLPYCLISGFSLMRNQMW